MSKESPKTKRDPASTRWGWPLFFQFWNSINLLTKSQRIWHDKKNGCSSNNFEIWSTISDPSWSKQKINMPSINNVKNNQRQKERLLFSGASEWRWPLFRLHFQRRSAEPPTDGRPLFLEFWFPLIKCSSVVVRWKIQVKIQDIYQYCSNPSTSTSFPKLVHMHYIGSVVNWKLNHAKQNVTWPQFYCKDAKE